MAGEVRIVYFLEDIAHEKFLRGIVTRIARQSGLNSTSFVEEVRNAAGGSPRALHELRRFLADMRAKDASPSQILVVAKDGNGAPYTQVRSSISAIVDSAGYGHPWYWQFRTPTSSAGT